MSNHSAVPTYVGFAFQPLHALLTLLRASDDESFVRIEAEDDVVLGAKGEVQQLQQLKHISHPLSHKSDNFWKTLKIWFDYIKENMEGSPYFVLITTSSIVLNDPIFVLSYANRSREQIKQLDDQLMREASRVCATDDLQTSKAAYEKRIRACRTYCSSKDEERLFLLSRVTIIPMSPQIDSIDSEIDKELRNIPQQVRSRLRTRIIEWWSNVSLRSILGERDRSIYKDELVRYLTTTASELLQDNLIDDMAHMTPPQIPPIPSTALRQLDLVEASDVIVRRSSRVHWLAREQRSKWVKDNPANHGRIDDFDRTLESEWESFFEEVCSSCLPNEQSQKKVGMQVLDWTHKEAHTQVGLIREGWSNPNLVRGTYQVLADMLKVGWHPMFKERLKGEEDASNK